MEVSKMEKVMYKKTHTNAYMSKMSDVIEWFAGKGFNAHASRYARYKNHIDEFYRSKSILEMEANFKNLNLAFRECVEIVTVYSAFKDEQSVGFHDRLEQVITGQDFFAPLSKNDSARDFLYELVVAADFNDLGYTIDFDQKTDVVAKRNEDIIFIECKRIKSSKRLEENFNKAGKQLSEIVRGNYYGLIFIDIYNCISNKIRAYPYQNNIDMCVELNNAVKGFCDDDERIINNLLDKYIDATSGVCFTTNVCLWLENVTPQFFKKRYIQVHKNSSDVKMKKLDCLLSKQ